MTEPLNDYQAGGVLDDAIRKARRDFRAGRRNWDAKADGFDFAVALRQLGYVIVKEPT